MSQAGGLHGPPPRASSRARVAAGRPARSHSGRQVANRAATEVRQKYSFGAADDGARNRQIIGLSRGAVPLPFGAAHAGRPVGRGEHLLRPLQQHGRGLVWMGVRAAPVEAEAGECVSHGRATHGIKYHCTEMRDTLFDREFEVLACTLNGGQGSRDERRRLCQRISYLVSGQIKVSVT